MLLWWCGLGSRGKSTGREKEEEEDKNLHQRMKKVHVSTFIPETVVFLPSVSTSIHPLGRTTKGGELRERMHMCTPNTK